MVKSVRKKPLEPAGRSISIDAWTLKCLYNRSDYSDRIASGEFVKLYEELGKEKANGERTVQAYYGRENDKLVMVRLQWFERDGVITRSGLKEPKWMYIDGLAYELHGGNRSWERLRRDLTEFRYGSSEPWLVKTKIHYANWRRYKCAQFGPVEARWRSSWFTSRPYDVFCFSRAWCVRRWIDARQATKPIRSRLRRLISGQKGPALVLA